MGSIRVDPGQIAEAGSSIEADAAQLDGAEQAIGSISSVAEPVETGRALEDLRSRWGSGVRLLRDDVEMLGRGTQAASTLYTRTDETAMGAG